MVEKAPSDSPPKGLNWSQREQSAELGGEQKPLAKLQEPGRGSDSIEPKGLFKREEPIPEPPPPAGKPAAPVAPPRPPARAASRPAHRRDEAEDKQSAKHKEPPAATFKEHRGTRLSDSPPSKEATEQAARSLFGSGGRAATIQGMPALIDKIAIPVREPEPGARLEIAEKRTEQARVSATFKAVPAPVEPGKPAANRTAYFGPRVPIEPPPRRPRPIETPIETEPRSAPRPDSKERKKEPEITAAVPAKRSRISILAAALIGLLILLSAGVVAVYLGFIPVSGSIRPPSRLVATATPRRRPAPPAPIPKPLAPAPQAPAEPSPAQQSSQPPQPEPAPQPKAETAQPVATPGVEAAKEPVGAGPAEAKPAPTPETAPAEDLRPAIARADRLLGRGALDEAEELLRAVLQKDRDEHHAMEVLIKVLLKRGRAAEAMPFAKRIVAKRPKRAPYRILYGDALAATGDRVAAEEQWRIALELSPDLAEARSRLEASPGETPPPSSPAPP